MFSPVVQPTKQNSKKVFFWDTLVSILESILCLLLPVGIWLCFDLLILTKHRSGRLKGATGSPLRTHGKWWWWQRFAWLWPMRTNVSLPRTVTTTGSGQPCQISQRSQQHHSFRPATNSHQSFCLGLVGYVGLLLRRFFRRLFWWFKQPALPYKGHGRPSFPPGMAMIALWTYLPTAQKSSAIISYHNPVLLLPVRGSKFNSFEVWTLKNYWLSILAFVIPSFCLSDSQFLVMSACSCPVFCHHHFPDVKGEHNLHRACLNLIFKTDFGWTPASSVTSCWSWS